MNTYTIKLGLSRKWLAAVLEPFLLFVRIQGRLWRSARRDWLGASRSCGWMRLVISPYLLMAIELGQLSMPIFTGPYCGSPHLVSELWPQKFRLGTISHLWTNPYQPYHHGTSHGISHGIADAIRSPSYPNHITIQWLVIYAPISVWWFLTGWWFGTFFVFPYIGNNNPNWRTHIFQRCRYTSHQLNISES